MATTKKGFMQPVLDRNKKIKANPGPLRAIKQTNNPLTPKPFQKAVKSIKQAVGKAAGKGKAESIAKSISAAVKAVAPKKAPAKKETFNLDAEVKKTMSGAYGKGDARKKALGANYSKVQAEINKRSAASKPKAVALKPAAKPAATPEAQSEQIVMKTKKVTEIPTSVSKQSQIATKSGGSGMGAKERADQDLAKQGFRKGGSVKKMQKGGMTKRKMMTGGMVNPNSSVFKQTVPGSRGVQSGVNPKASSSKVAGSRGSGNANTPPSKAVPTAKRGGMVKKKR
jgi:hypothetical protein